LRPCCPGRRSSVYPGRPDRLRRRRMRRLGACPSHGECLEMGRSAKQARDEAEAKPHMLLRKSGHVMARVYQGNLCDHRHSHPRSPSPPSPLILQAQRGLVPLQARCYQRVVAGGGGRCSAAERRPARRPDIRSAATSRRPNGSRHPDLSSACSARQQPAESKRGRSTPKPRSTSRAALGLRTLWQPSSASLGTWLRPGGHSLTHSLTHSLARWVLVVDLLCAYWCARNGRERSSVAPVPNMALSFRSRCTRLLKLADL